MEAGARAGCADAARRLDRASGVPACRDVGPALGSAGGRAFPSAGDDVRTRRQGEPRQRERSRSAQGTVGSEVPGLVRGRHRDSRERRVDRELDAWYGQRRAEGPPASTVHGDGAHVPRRLGGGPAMARLRRCGDDASVRRGHAEREQSVHVHLARRIDPHADGRSGRPRVPRQRGAPFPVLHVPRRRPARRRRRSAGRTPLVPCDRECLWAEPDLPVGARPQRQHRPRERWDDRPHRHRGALDRGEQHRVARHRARRARPRGALREEVVPVATDEPGLTEAGLEQRVTDVRNAAVMSVGTLLSRATGVVCVSVTVYAIGTTNVVANAYFIANTTPNIVYELILGGILTSVFVPLLVDWAKRHGDEAGRIAGARFLTFVLVVLSAVTVVAMVAAPWIMRLYLVGVKDPADYAAQLELGTFFLRWFLPQIVFYGIGAVAAGILTANRRFAAQMYAPVLNNIAVIATMLVFSAMHGKGTPMTLAEVSPTERLVLAAGTTLGVVGMTIALWPSLRAIGFRWRLRFDWRHETVRRLLHLARWVALYVVVNQIAYFFIIVFNGRVDGGTYAVYSQAFIFFSLPHAIVAVSIFTALLPSLAGAWTDRNIPNVRELFSQGLRDTEVAMLPAAAGYAVLAGPIVALLASYGQMKNDPASVDLLAKTLAAFAVGLPFFSAFQLLTRTFYAIHDARTPALTNIVAAVVNLVIDVVLAFAFGLGVVGLALGFSVSYVSGSALLFALLRRRLGGADGRRIANSLGRTAAAAALTALAAWATAEGIAAVIDVGRPVLNLVQVVAAVAAGVLAFVLGALIFQIEEADEVWRALAARFRR